MTLALMALVTAASTGHQSRLGAQPYEAAPAGRHPTAGTGPTSTVTTSTSAAIAPVTAPDPAQPVSTTRTTSPATMVTTTTAGLTVTTTTATVGSGTGNAPRQTSAKSDQGFLEPPDNTTAIYAFYGTGLTTVSVTWTPQVELALTATCANGSQSGQGSGSLELTLPDAQGSCQLTLSEPASESADVTFSLTITPAASD